MKGARGAGGREREADRENMGEIFAPRKFKKVVSVERIRRERKFFFSPFHCKGRDVVYSCDFNES